MLLVVDANALVEDPDLSGPVWMEIRQAVETGHLRVVVPKIAILEATAGVRARRRAEIPKKIRIKHSAAVKSTMEAAAAAISIWADAYDAADVVTKAGFEIAPSPEVPHDVLAQRAISRIPPFDANGGGYRDSLHWFTLLEAAKKSLAEDIVFVSKDNTFALAGVLHPELVDEGRRELDGREVLLCRDLSTLAVPGRFSGPEEPVTLSPAALEALQEALFPEDKLILRDLWAGAGLSTAEDAELSEPRDFLVDSAVQRELAQGGWVASALVRFTALVQFDWLDAVDGTAKREHVQLFVTYRLDPEGKISTIDDVDLRAGESRVQRESSDAFLEWRPRDLTEAINRAVQAAMDPRIVNDALTRATREATSPAALARTLDSIRQVTNPSTISDAILRATTNATSPEALAQVITQSIRAATEPAAISAAVLRAARAATSVQKLALPDARPSGSSRSSDAKAADADEE